MTSERSTATAQGDLREDVGFLLSIARARTSRRANEALAALDLRARTYSVLAMAATADGITQRDVADALSLNPSQIVPLVDDLADRGLVERRPHASDRRARVIAATDAGRALHADARERVRRAMDQVLRDLDERERETLRGLLARVIAGADDAS
ncbi:MarR family winged helix-turn-helix transcriptional regulator [Mumia sp. DW29H23]|uniref:MarR family winged helix-turn-helix transcriptional regulator n=1 Tax=Mumia sp. DW29H23 TaxID=3421241 RepID=UPI003D68B322